MDSTVNKTEYRSKRNPTGKPRRARQTAKASGPTISSIDKSLSKSRMLVAQGIRCYTLVQVQVMLWQE